VPAMASGNNIRRSSRRLRKDRSKHHGGDRRHRIVSKISRHAGAVADIVAGHCPAMVCGIARISSGCRLPPSHHVAADIRALSEDAAAKAREDRNQRGPKTKRNSALITTRLCTGSVTERPKRPVRNGVIGPPRQKAEPDHQKTRDGAGSKGRR